MKSPLIAIVEFELFPDTVIEKTQGYLSGVRPNHYIEELGCTVIGEVDFEGGRIDMGSSKQAIITYAFWEPFEKVLQKGLKYEVREGSRVVGKVKVLEVAGNTRLVV